MITIRSGYIAAGLTIIWLICAQPFSMSRKEQFTYYPFITFATNHFASTMISFLFPVHIRVLSSFAYTNTNKVHSPNIKQVPDDIVLGYTKSSSTFDINSHQYRLGLNVDHSSSQQYPLSVAQHYWSVQTFLDSSLNHINWKDAADEDVLICRNC